MNSQKALRRLGCGLILIGAACAWQRPFRVYPSMEPYDDIPLPSDWQNKSEWVFGRLMYPQHPQAHFNRYSRRYGGGGIMDWREGGTSWTQDYPRADRHFAQALRRLTRVDARSVEQPVNLDDPDDVFYWPWLCAVRGKHEAGFPGTGRGGNRKRGCDFSHRLRLGRPVSDCRRVGAARREDLPQRR